MLQHYFYVIINLFVNINFSGSNYSLVVNKERLYDIINKFGTLSHYFSYKITNLFIISDQFLPKMYKDNLNVLLYNNSKL